MTGRGAAIGERMRSEQITFDGERLRVLRTTVGGARCESGLWVTFTFYQQREDWDGGCDWGEDTVGSVTLGDVTTYACPAAETLPCGGDPPSCTVTDECEPIVISRDVVALDFEVA